MTKNIFLLAISANICACSTAPIEIEFVGRTQDQMGSFYEARGFPDEMLDIIDQHCLVTTGIRNISDDIVWLERENWEFSIDGKPIDVRSRKQWKAFWTEMGIAKNHQATFHWTQLPDVLDYLPDEREGGNISFPRTDKVIHIKARFATGKNKQGEPFTIEHDVRCAEDKK